MKYIYVFVFLIIFSACSKDEGYGRFNLKDGQEVELSVGHRYGAIGDEPLLLPQNESPQLPLSAFDIREAGYQYKVKAKLVVYHGPPIMDGGSGHSLQFVEVISKNKYEGNESFELSLVRSIVPGPEFIPLRNDGDKYLYIIDSKNEIQLTFTDQEVGKKLAEIWNFNKKNFSYYSTPREELKWKSIKATVTHDASNFGKAYLVSNIEMKEK